METYQNSIERRICDYRQIYPNKTIPVELFNSIADCMPIVENHRVDQAATQAAREYAPNVILIYWDGECQEYAKLEFDGTVTFWGYEPPDCGTDLISEMVALDQFYDSDKIVGADLSPLRFVLRAGIKYYDADDIWAIYENKKSAREKRYDEQRILTIDLPDEFLLLCEQYDLTPAQALRGFIGDVCGIVNYTNHPTIPRRTDGYNSHGSDERDMADSYWKRAHWNPDIEEKYGISVF